MKVYIFYFIDTLLHLFILKYLYFICKVYKNNSIKK